MSALTRRLMLDLLVSRDRENERTNEDGQDGLEDIDPIHPFACRRLTVPSEPVPPDRV